MASEDARRAYLASRGRADGKESAMTESASLARPKRIQRKRTKGWTMPEGAVYVGRPSKYGNPYEVTKSVGRWYVFDRRTTDGYLSVFDRKEDAQRHAVKLWITDFYDDPLRLVQAAMVTLDLAGKNLACWCPLDTPCHADVLLDIANEWGSDGHA